MKVLLVAQNEVCYNPRLVKAGDYYASHGCEVTVLNPIVGFSSEVYNEFCSKRKWKFLENRLDKKSTKSYFKWLVVSLINKIFVFNWKHFKSRIGYPYIMSKGVMFAEGLFSKDDSYDIIHTNLMELLPFASELKEQHPNARLVFDSQEYFKGQYSKYDKFKYDWIVETENKYLKNADLVLVTTNAMKHKIAEEGILGVPMIRVRNLPSSGSVTKSENDKKDGRTLSLVWHGMSINFGNCRGVQVLIEALAHCKTNVHLNLQGKISDNDYNQIESQCLALNVWDKVSILPPAKPDEIVDSIKKHDVGLAGELPEEENQLLTSSNKLFEYIAAGLCTIVPDLPGLKETITEYETGVLYKSGDFVELGSLIDELNLNREKLNEFKKNSFNAAAELYWEKDFEQVWKEIEKF
jgi:glycosyltransferase involved in cell wall biosynthesis